MATLALHELLTLIFVAVVLATTDAAALSDMGVAWLSKKLGVKPGDIRAYDAATSGDDPPPADADDAPAEGE